MVKVLAGGKALTGKGFQRMPSSLNENRYHYKQHLTMC
ncbi:hypothetical protein ACS15_1205 [Ralstonia insidiosa]|uniref:Uncharacterized protein n=1 Tax=Ralstonia insidiosa TaxID=190721 RepID=A0AAC9FPD9_9RALS|nr:hypothetical protein ACS15_1205 [Ralstonia insidiosa]